MFVPVKVRSFGFQRDALGRIVAKFSAFFASHNASFCAQNLLSIQLGSVDAVAAGTLDFLFEKHSSKSFIARFGNIAGYDIESTDSEIVAECFAQVSYKNNKKLDKDLEKLNSVTYDAICYEFFYDKVFNEDNYKAYKNKYPEINIIKFEALK